MIFRDVRVGQEPAEEVPDHAFAGAHVEHRHAAAIEAAAREQRVAKGGQ